MYNLNGFLIRPEHVSLVSPVRQVPGQAEFAFRVVLGGGYEHICISPSHEHATRLRNALIAACDAPHSGSEELAAPTYVNGNTAKAPDAGSQARAPLEPAAKAPARSRDKPARRSSGRMN
ncbi:MAG TPA: hypothetical protein VEY50_06630 [Lysobacter sp.]|nr:hypothetical protein [Lysobacter sp.]